jgi:hypothetical protein
MFNQYEAHSADISESRIINSLMLAVNKAAAIEDGPTEMSEANGQRFRFVSSGCGQSHKDSFAAISLLFLLQSVRHNCYCPIRLSGEQACYQSDRLSHFLYRNRDEGQHSRTPDH